MPILELCAGYGGLGMAVEALTGDKVAYVAAIRSRGLPEVAADMASVGYDLRWTCLRASDGSVGLAHHRDRWFGLAVPADTTSV